LARAKTRAKRPTKQLNHAEPPRISRDLLVLALGYRLQEIAHGGLGKSTRRKLQTMAKALRTTGRVGPAPCLSLKPGARLLETAVDRKIEDQKEFVPGDGAMHGCPHVEDLALPKSL
jgi:Protein of unknown function (DUF2924)